MNKKKIYLIPSIVQLSSEISYSRIAHILFAVFVACTIALPAAPLNKVLFLFLYLWFFLYFLTRSIRLRFPSIAPAIIICIFVYGFILAQFNYVDTQAALQFLLAPLILPLIYFIDAFNINMDKLAVKVSYLIMVCTVIFLASLVFPELPLLKNLSQFLIDYNMSSISEREFFEGGVTFTLALSTVPFIFVGFCVVGMRQISDNSQSYDWLRLLLMFVVIVASGQRALIGITLLYASYLFLTVTRPGYRVLVLALMCFAAILIWIAYLDDSQIFSADEISNKVKIGHLLSYLDNLSPINIIFGSGLASYYYSSGSQVMKAFTELTPVDFCRYFGIPLTLVLYAVLFFPLRGLWRLKFSHYGYTVGMVLYFILSITNPVMFNSYGLLVVLWYWRSLVCSNNLPNKRASL